MSSFWRSFQIKLLEQHLSPMISAIIMHLKAGIMYIRSLISLCIKPNRNESPSAQHISEINTHQARDLDFLVLWAKKKLRFAIWCDALSGIEPFPVFRPKRSEFFFGREDSRPTFCPVLQLHVCKIIRNCFTLWKQISPYVIDATALHPRLRQLVSAIKNTKISICFLMWCTVTAW